MNPELLKKSWEFTSPHEGIRRRPYQDSMGIWTVGCGHNLENGPDLSDRTVWNIYEDDACLFYDLLYEEFPWFKDLSDGRKVALLDMCFMGYSKFMQFKKLFKAIEAKDWLTASKEVLNSKWATQVKSERSSNVAITLLQG